MTPQERSPVVLVVDDDDSFRKAIHRLITACGFDVELFATAEAVLARRSLDGPGCILLDLNLPGKSGLDVQSELAARGAGTPIVFLTGRGDIPTSVTAIKAGAIDFLTKPVRQEPLIAALTSAFERDRQRLAAAADRRDVLMRVKSLTPRELEVMQLVVRGLLNKQIAADLGTSEATVKVHRARVMQKMRVVSVADLVRAAQSAGLETASAPGDTPAAPESPPRPSIPAASPSTPIKRWR